MSDPYKVLGISPNASDDEVKNAYRNLAKKYHPDNYENNPLSDLAQEKMREINQAYDEITSQRKGQSSAGGGYQNYGGGYQGSSSNSNFADIRRMIQGGRYADAELLLNGIPESSRDAEWYFLKGTVLYRKGFLENATTHFQQACNMAPNNMEYRAALNQINSQRYGYNGPYRTTGSGQGCNSCDMCSSLICADCCCECMGGDLIPCC